ncbi:MAG: helix-turn-helix transcriptional regulator [Elusimicrobia bacterium]|nr:helix-turn-helix transcriptional regulator [Elusimicrobiota bacterium]
MARKIVKYRDYLKDQLKNANVREHWKAYEVPVKLAIEIAMLRQKKRMTQAQLAKKMGVSQQMVAQLENPEEETAPNVRTLEKVAKALGSELYIGFK